MIVDHSNGRVLDILPSRDKESVVQYLRQKKGAGLLASVTEVTCDMWDAYANAATEVFGTSVLVTIDRFHVIRSYAVEGSGSLGRTKSGRIVSRVTPENFPD